MTLSPMLTSSGTRLPLSSMRPGPMARTSPSWGFSLAVSGMTRPEAVVCSASSGWTTIRSSRGLMLTDTSDQPLLSTCRWLAKFAACERYAVAGVVRRHKRWHTHGESASDETSTHTNRVPDHPGWKTADVDLDAFRWLLTEPGQRLLVAAAETVETETDPLRAGSALRRTASPEQVAAALTQVELRRRAEAKFGDLAGRMYFTPDGLEQATRLPVASH